MMLYRSKMNAVVLIIVLFSCCVSQLDAYTGIPAAKPLMRYPPMMGRASNVRAATKARTDAVKSKNNCIYAKKIIVAVKAGGPDPISNRLLAQVIADAKVANVPKDIIVRNIEKATSTTTSDYKESLFEFYGFGGAGLLVSVLTDNGNRAASDINLVAKKHALKHAAVNSVKFKFVTKARLDVPATVTEEAIMELCLKHDIDDYQLLTDPDGGNLSPAEAGRSVILVNMQDMATMRDALSSEEYTATSKLVSVPLEGYVEVSDEEFSSNMAAIYALEALDDVDTVEHNIDTRVRFDRIPE
jgi:YebC/PmpR family DNA-binding regulatory protein